MGAALRPSQESRDPGGGPMPADGGEWEDMVPIGPLEPQNALRLLDEVAEGLDAAHAGAAVAADRQPARLLLEAAGVDRPATGRPDSGTPLEYVSPEQILGRDEGQRSDVYSLSALLYRCLTGSAPFPPGRRRAVLFWHLHAPRPRATAVRPQLPAAIDGVIARGMAPDPAARHPTVDELLRQARDALGSSVTPEARALKPPASAAPARPSAGNRKRARSRLMWIGAAAMLALGAGFLGFAVAGALDDPPRRLTLAGAGPVQVAAPADWRRSPAPPASLGLARTVTLRPVNARGMTLVAGVATPAASLDLLRRLAPSPPAGELVALARMQARRYRAAHAPGFAGPVTLFLAPTDVGIATVACLASGTAAAAASIRRCERVAASLRLAAGRSTAAAPTSREAVGLRRVLRRLNAARSLYKSRLRRSRTAAAQATAARAVARAHLRAARSLRSLALTGLAEPGGRAAIGALRRAAAAYRGAARAAVRSDRRRYALARSAALAADGALGQAMRMLRVVGYPA